MSHVLVHGPRSEYEQLRSYLTGCGWTVGSAPALGGGRPWPTVQECDAVILVGEGAALLGAGPDGAEEPASAPAPLLFLAAADAGAPAEIELAGTRERLADLGAALEACRLRSCALRGAPHGTATDGRLRDQLGHELRSPLTALKTALELLADAVAEAEGADGGAPDHRRILDIAQRNVQRLHRAVEWSEVVLGATAPAVAGADAPPAAVAEDEHNAAELMAGSGV